MILYRTEETPQAPNLILASWNKINGVNNSDSTLFGRIQLLAEYAPPFKVDGSFHEWWIGAWIGELSEGFIYNVNHFFRNRGIVSKIDDSGFRQVYAEKYESKYPEKINPVLIYVAKAYVTVPFGFRDQPLAQRV